MPSMPSMPSRHDVFPDPLALPRRGGSFVWIVISQGHGLIILHSFDGIPARRCCQRLSRPRFGLARMVDGVRVGYFAAARATLVTAAAFHASTELRSK